eukprot:c21875_g2_i1 orf=197-2620(+)
MKMVIQQEHGRRRQWGVAEPSEEINASNEDGRCENELEEDGGSDGVDFKTGYLRAQLLRKDPGHLLRGDHADGLNQRSVWDSANDNLPKAVIVGLLLLSAFILVVVRNRSDTAAILCIESVVEDAKALPYPNVDFKRVRRLVDSGKYGTVNAEKWIVVAVSGPPTKEIRALVRLQGWQVVAIGNSKTPASWNVKGAIFLSVEQQATLGYRILGHLPYNSYVRKSVGYLFAIQHGAKVIYDADQNASLLGADLGKMFDEELTGPNSRKEPLLQYTPVHNRTCVNPFIHFGQRSVWPRGLPLESVGEINPDIYYEQVFSGKQFIQQGLSNGLPDVDSIFYHTRKSGFESFDISFDMHAPPVALPQGLMAPVNNLNTLFHSPAFWALMLPVSVSAKASDIIRGYWAQRLLWEIGGYTVIYPPTVHRMDSMESPSFEDEKDLHRYIGKLLTFLVSWRSQKLTLFQKILHLSHSMAGGGFWTAQDVVYTAAWLQDLISVGYLQPRLFALELDGGKPSFPQADHEKFLPLRLPSVHLGVEEASSVSSQIDNLLRWRKFYGNIVLILHCSWPFNHTALGWKILYGRIFKSVVVVSEESDMDLGVEASDWRQAYKVLPKIFRMYRNAEGFLFMKDDVILNYWTLLQANKTRLWTLHKVNRSWKVLAYNETGSAWYHSNSTKVHLQTALSYLPAHFQITYHGNMDDEHFVMSNSDAFYVPRRFVRDFTDLVTIGDKSSLRQELAIPFIFLALDSVDNYDVEAFSNVVYKTKVSSNPAALYTAEKQAVHPWKVLTEHDLHGLLREMASGDPLLLEFL